MKFLLCYVRTNNQMLCSHVNVKAGRCSLRAKQARWWHLGRDTGLRDSGLCIIRSIQENAAAAPVLQSLSVVGSDPGFAQLGGRTPRCGGLLRRTQVGLTYFNLTPSCKLGTQCVRRAARVDLCSFNGITSRPRTGEMR